MINRLLFSALTIVTICMKSEGQSGFQFTKDESHTQNEMIQEEKKIILSQLMKFDDWYKSENHFMRYDSRRSRWYTSSGMYEWPEVLSLDERKKIFSGDIIPAVRNTDILTEKFKTKILSNHANLDDPGNLAFLMTRNPKGKEVMNLLIADLDGFYVYLGLSSLLYSDEPGYEPELPKIEEKDKINYYCEMISIKENQATFVLDRGAVYSNPPRSYGDYIVISLIKSKEGKWLVNNLQILDEGEQIVNE